MYYKTILVLTLIVTAAQGCGPREKHARRNDFAFPLVLDVWITDNDGHPATGRWQVIPGYTRGHSGPRFEKHKVA